MSEDIRCFIAISLDTKIKSIIEKIHQDLSGLEASLRWVKPELAHITLKFLGSVPSNRLEQLHSAIRDGIAGSKIFSFSLSRIGAFPNLHRPNVVWLGIDEGAHNIKDLAERLEDALGRIGFKKEERPFHSHITIARIKEENRHTPLGGFIEKYHLSENHTQICSRVALVKSTLHPCGPKYDILETFNLNQ